VADAPLTLNLHRSSEWRTILSSERVSRRLAAILALDMVGYSRHVEIDEAGTIMRQRQHRQDLIDPVLRDHGGRIVKTTGDGLIVELSSVVDALESAVGIQLAIAAAEAPVASDRRIQYRAGINLGDIVIDDILGDGVNIAAARQYDEAVAWADKAIHLYRNFPTAHRLLATSLSDLGDTGRARVAIRDLLEVAPAPPSPKPAPACHGRSR
jgi:class 3 adenylate cyclase